jgi:hypothetical protein
VKRAFPDRHGGEIIEQLKAVEAPSRIDRDVRRRFGTLLDVQLEDLDRRRRSRWRSAPQGRSGSE